MAGINKVILVGNLGNDPEIRYAPSGDAIANLSIATSESWKDKNTGEKKEKTEWHRVVLGGEMQFLDSRSGGEYSAPAASQAQSAPAASAPAKQPAPAMADDFDDDIPF